MHETPVNVAVSGVCLPGILGTPQDAKGLVVFAHGSGSSRKSPRNGYIAKRLQTVGFATLLFDMLTENEDAQHDKQGDIDLRAWRLQEAIEWIETQSAVRDLPIGLFGASTGAAAALKAAAKLGHRVSAVVSRGGRPDLASAELARVTCPTLLIVGSHDIAVIGFNEAAMHALPSSTAKRMRVIPRATHLFEEAGALEKVARMAAEWYLRFSVPPLGG